MMDERMKSIIRDYADGEITAEQLSELESSLLEDSSLREQFLSELNLHATLEDLASGTSEIAGLSSMKTDSPSQHRSWLWPLGFVAAVVIVLCFYLIPFGEQKIVTIVGHQGPIRWTGGAGEVSEQINNGQEFAGGTVELLSAESWLEFKFRDGTKVTLAGQSAVTVSEKLQKELHLRRGSMSADVQPQPKEYPLLVHTEVAELQVLGTQFNVDAGLEETRLAVNEGRVRLRRKSDGQQVEVQAQHKVTASFDSEVELDVTSSEASTSVWRSNLRSDAIHGQWYSNLWLIGLRLKKAVANGEMTKADAMAAYKDAATLDEDEGSIWATPEWFGSLIVLSVTRSSDAPVILTPTSRFRIQGQLPDQPDREIEFGITLNDPQGGFHGKYSVAIPSAHLNAGDGGYTVELKLSDFTNRTGGKGIPVGKELRDWWCFSKTKIKFAVSQVELFDASEIPNHKTDTPSNEP